MPTATTRWRIGASLLVSTALIFGGAFTASAAPTQGPASAPRLAQADNTVLEEGEQLNVGGELYADAGIGTAARVQFRKDRLQTQYGWGLWWTDGGWGQDVKGANRVVMQGDGNLVAYTPQNRAVWYTGTGNKPANVKAKTIVTNLGEMIVYHGDKPVWRSTNPGNPTPEPEPAKRNTLKAGEFLKPGEMLTSPNGNFRTIFQGDGNVVTYNNDSKAIWNTQTSGKAAAKFVMQGDANLVLYAADGRSYFWNSQTVVRNAKNPRVTLRNTGALEILVGDKVIWSSAKGSTTPDPQPGNTNVLNAGQSLGANQQLVSENGEYRLILQGDGNVVVYNKANVAQWNAGTTGKGGVKLVMQGDANLVLYTADNKAVWYTATGRAGAKNPRAMMRNSGAFEVLLGDTTIWSSRGNSTPTPTPTPGVSNTLKMNESLAVNGKLVSSNGEYRLVVQTDGNVVIYNKADKPQWNSQTAGKSASKLIMQGDANLVLYGTDNVALWNSQTSRANASARAILRDTGVLDIVNHDEVIWSSHKTAPSPDEWRNGLLANEFLIPGRQLKSENGAYRMVFQGDGNLVIYNNQNQALWNSGTSGKTDAAKFVMQSDGNLVLYTDKGVALWNAGTGGRNPVNPRVILQNDGVMIVKHGDTVMWKSN